MTTNKNIEQGIKTIKTIDLDTVAGGGMTSFGNTGVTGSNSSGYFTTPNSGVLVDPYTGHMVDSGRA
jgi:hypothetical protein